MTPASDHRTREFLAGLEKWHTPPQAASGTTREAYEGARVGRLTRNWQPDHRSGDAAISESWSMLTARTRDQVRNNPLFGKAQQMLCDLIVGTGIRAFATPFDLTRDVGSPGDDEQLDRELDYAIESDDLFDEWANNWADVERRYSFYDLCYHALADCIEVGDALLIRSELPMIGGRRIQTAYQLVEREQLDTAQDRPRAPGVNPIVNGIELGEDNAPVRYWILDAHPYDTYHGGLFSGSTPVPAERVIHLYKPSRASAHVGISWFAPMVRPARDRDWLTGNVLTSAALAALCTILHKTKNPGGSLSLDDGEDETDGYENDLVKWGHGLLFKVPPEDDVTVIESNRPNANIPPFVEMLDHDLAAGAKLSYYRTTGRYNNVSYTAVRGAHLDDDQHVKPLQQWIGRLLVEPIRRRVNAEAAAMGYFRTITPREFARDPMRWQRFETIGPGREQLDPEMETEASVAKLRAGLSNLMYECALRGKHWIRVLRQASLENRIARRLGLVLDFSKQQGGQATSSTRQATTEPATKKAAAPADDDDPDDEEA